ncbi:domain of Kin17 curved DNA-binding protein-domain-containing protein [Aspergillus coremiiformis]|uniref:Domain of Kin17 curved DNA-binding protein-domain-containing protein n=1 Tax=Aspergillus coremiiformis TaxID=138285 RepID=A0A5N6Z2R2_9EURO|nr:domain of Kin17 curved DNA-binding protein-domain-containing protein [Aspergillus coremiiformis]
MPRAEAGSTKALSNKLKSKKNKKQSNKKPQKGLQRLRWYCQLCEKQCRDENGFKCHVQSESHVRQAIRVGEDPKRYIEDYSKEFLSNFLNQLRTSHGEKQICANKFYQEIIADKTHIHMNATKWKSLSQFAAFLGREGMCRVEETEKGLFISYIDRSPEAMRRREAILKKERQDRGDEEREQREIREQVERARRNVEGEGEVDVEARNLQRKEGEKVRLNLGFGSKGNGELKAESLSLAVEKGSGVSLVTSESAAVVASASSDSTPAEDVPKAGVKLSMSLGDKKPKNVFATAVKKNPLAGKKGSVLEAPKKMSEQERIMKQEMEAMERKRMRGTSGMPNPKRPKMS